MKKDKLEFKLSKDWSGFQLEKSGFSNPISIRKIEKLLGLFKVVIVSYFTNIDYFCEIITS